MESPRTRPGTSPRGHRVQDRDDEFPEQLPSPPAPSPDDRRDGRPPGPGPRIVPPIADGVEVLAPAKLNLFLEILGRRPDGYHEVETLMVAVDLHDTLTIVDDPSGRISLACDDPALPTGPENLVVRAAERLKAES